MMEILESEWLINMLEKSGKTPAARMLSLFDIVSDWLQAPRIKDQPISFNSAAPAPLVLHQYLIKQSTLANAALPEMLASQIYFMLSASIHDAITTASFEKFSHAKEATRALISAQSEKTISISKTTLAYGITASIILVAGLTYLLTTMTPVPYNKLNTQNIKVASSKNNDPGASAVNPMQISELFRKIEQMRKGNCQFPEALQIPDQHKSAYINVVVGGQAPADARELEIANVYLQKVRCNYTPMLMSNSRD